MYGLVFVPRGPVRSLCLTHAGIFLADPTGPRAPACPSRLGGTGLRPGAPSWEQSAQVRLDLLGSEFDKQVAKLADSQPPHDIGYAFTGLYKHVG